MLKNEKNIVWIFSFFVVGGLIGAAIALLMAPQSGEKTRALIRDKSVELKDRVVDTAEDTYSQAEDVVGDLASETRDRAKSVREAIKI